MAQLDNLVKLDMVFDLTTSTAVQDSAQFGIWGQLNFAPADSAAWDTALGELAQFGVDNWSSVVGTTRYSGGALLKHARAARCDTAGHTVNEAIKTPGTAWQGDTTQPSLPWSTSLCVSLYCYEPGTFTPLARRKRGRVYLPPLNSSMLADHRSGEPTLALCQALRDDFGTWLKNVQNHNLIGAGQQWDAGVSSNSTGLKPPGSPTWLPVTFLRVDNKLDTQRRRERQELAERSVIAFPF